MLPMYVDAEQDPTSCASPTTLSNKTLKVGTSLNTHREAGPS